MLSVVCAAALLLTFQPTETDALCESRSYGHGSSVCVCSGRGCGALQDPPAPPPAGGFSIYTSSKAGMRLHHSSGKFTLDYPLRPRDAWTEVADQDHFVVNAEKAYQIIHGFGGAITDSAGINIHSLSAGTRDILMRALFGREGNAYSLLRVPIGGTDHSTRLYTYAETPDDLELKYFRLAEEDLQYKIPVVLNATTLSDGKLRVIASAWSAPTWMKSNNQLVSGVLKRELYQLWADYHMRFVTEYGERGVPVWALTTGNEPINAFLATVIKFNSMGWTPVSHREWVGRFLGPTVRNSTQFNETVLLALDDQRMLLPWWIDMMFDDPETRRYVDGIAVHWYWSIIEAGFVLDMTHNRYPDKFLISTEACSGDKPWTLQKVQLGSWSRGENYMADILRSVNSWITGWVEWSLVLNMEGGPTWSGNKVDASVIVDADRDEVLLQPSYFAMAHFSRYVPPGSRRVRLSRGERRGPVLELVAGRSSVDAAAFRTPNGSVAVVMHNTADRDVPVTLRDARFGVASVVLPAFSFNTIEYAGDDGEQSERSAIREDR